MGTQRLHCLAVVRRRHEQVEVPVVLHAFFQPVKVMFGL